MHEIIITHVVPEIDNEPAHTVVFRFELEVNVASRAAINRVIGVLSDSAVAGGVMENR